MKEMRMSDVPMGNESRGNNMTKAQQTGIRVAVSIVVATVVAVTVLLVGWRSIGSYFRFRMEQAQTLRTLRDFNLALAEYQRLHNAPPQSQGEFTSFVKERGYDGYRDDNDVPLDGWRRPFAYSVKDGKPLIVSYGRDGKPGGVGLDNDLSNEDLPPVDDDRLPEKVRPTFSQFFVDASARRLEFNCLISGLLAFWLSMSLIKTVTLNGRDIALLLLKLAFTIGGTLVTAAVISLSDLPNPH
jgi:general secretion pathway protein G